MLAQSVFFITYVVCALRFEKQAVCINRFAVPSADRQDSSRFIHLSPERRLIAFSIDATSIRFAMVWGSGIGSHPSTPTPVLLYFWWLAWLASGYCGVSNAFATLG